MRIRIEIQTVQRKIVEVNKTKRDFMSWHDTGTFLLTDLWNLHHILETLNIHKISLKCLQKTDESVPQIKLLVILVRPSYELSSSPVGHSLHEETALKYLGAKMQRHGAFQSTQNFFIDLKKQRLYERVRSNFPRSVSSTAMCMYI